MVSLALIYFAFLLAILPVRFIGTWKQDGKKWLLLWAGLTTAAFLCGHFLIFCLVIWITCAVLMKEMPGRAATIYVLFLPMLPTFPFILSGIPGINMLFAMDYTRTLTLFLLLPAYIAVRSATRGKPLQYNAVDIVFISYSLWWILVVIANRISVTDVLRQIFEILVFFLIPYVAVRRLLRTREQIRDVISALVFTGIVVSAICIVEAAMTRTLYTDLASRLHTEPLSGLAYIRQFRFGFLRVRGTMEAGLPIFAVLALGALLCFAKLEKITRGRFWSGVALLSIPVIFSGSRGTWIMAAMMLATWIGFPLIKTPVRFVTVMLAGYIVSPIIQAYLLSTADQFGTFSYRQRLLETFLPVVWEKPWMGWGSLRHLYSTNRFNHLIQGESIIDMVNTFLSEALLRGIPGFLFFSGIFLFGVIVPLRKLQRDSPQDAALDYPVVKWVCSFMPAVAFLLITTSLVGHSWVYISLAASVAAAIGSLGTLQTSPATAPGVASTAKVARK